MRQIELAEKISQCISALRKSGCDVIAKQDCLQVYKSKELEYSHLTNPCKKYSYEHPIPYLNAGRINDSGADDAEYFIDDYIAN